MASFPQIALLAGDFECKDSTEDYDSTEEERLSEVGDYVKFSEQFFPSEVTGTQDCCRVLQTIDNNFTDK